MTNRNRIFVSYSHLDNQWLDKLKEVIAPDIRNDRIDYWNDKQIEPGDPWFDKIILSINQARIAILLVSPNFLSSKFIMEEELPRILEAVEDGLTLVWIPLYGEFENYEELEIFNQLKDRQAVIDIKTPLSSLNKEEQNQKLIETFRIIKKKLGESRKINCLPFLSIHSLFKGRNSDLLKIIKHFEENNENETVSYPIVVSGGCGIGKTRLAHEYAYNHFDNFSAVLFVSATTPNDLEINIAKLSEPKKLDLQEYYTNNQNEKYSAVIRWLQETPYWLLIIDNVDTVESVSEVKKLIPLLGSGQVIITSTYTRWGKGIAKMELHSLPIKEAIELINDATKEERDSMPDDNKTLQILVEKLGCLPLAITHAASYISNLQISLKKYIETFDNNFSKLIKYYDKEEMDYDPTALKTVSTTYSLSIEQLDSMGKAILRMASILAPQPIQVAMLENCDNEITNLEKLWLEKEGGTRTSIEVLEAIAELAKFSLVTRNKDLFSIHRFEHSILRHKIPEKDFTDWYSATRDIIIKYIPDEIAENPETWNIWNDLHPHIVALTLDKNDLIQDKSQIDLNNQLACYYYGKQQFKEALKSAIKAYELAKNVYKNDSEEFAFILVNTGEEYRLNDNLIEAEKLFRKALFIREKLFGKDSLKVAITLNYLALAIDDPDKTKNAKILFEKALKIYNKNIKDADKHKVARVLNNLALVCSSLGQIEKADNHYQKAIEYLEHPESAGPYHIHTQQCKINYAVFLQQHNRIKESLKIFEETLSICAEKLTINHNISITCCANYIEVLLNTNDLKKSCSVLLSHINLMNDMSESDFLDNFSSNSLNSLAVELHNQGNLEIAEKVSRKALNKEKEGNRDNYLLKRSKALEIYQSGDYKQAKILLEELLQANFEVLSIRIHLARLALVTDNLLEAEQQINKVWDLRKEARTYVLGRILWFKVVHTFLNRSSLTFYLGQLKTVLQNEDAFMDWIMQPVLEHLKPNLTVYEHSFLSALVSALSDKNNLSALDDFEEWKEAKPIVIN